MWRNFWALCHNWVYASVYMGTNVSLLDFPSFYPIYNCISRWSKPETTEFFSQTRYPMDTRLPQGLLEWPRSETPVFGAFFCEVMLIWAPSFLLSPNCYSSWLGNVSCCTGTRKIFIFLCESIFKGGKVLFKQEKKKKISQFFFFFSPCTGDLTQGCFATKLYPQPFYFETGPCYLEPC